MNAKHPKTTAPAPRQVPCAPCTVPSAPVDGVQGDRLPVTAAAGGTPAGEVGEAPPAISPAGLDVPGTAAAGGREEPQGCSRPPGFHPLAAAMSENELEQHIRSILADLPTVLWYHTHDSRRSPSGFPDLVCVGPGGVIYRELKTAKGRISTTQECWLEALAMAGQDACVWRPGDLLSGLIARRLAALAGLVRAT